MINRLYWDRAEGFACTLRPESGQKISAVTGNGTFSGTIAQFKEKKGKSIPTQIEGYVWIDWDFSPKSKAVKHPCYYESIK